MTYGRKQITCPPGTTEGEAESFHKHIFKRQDQKQYIATSERLQLQILHSCPEPLAHWDCSALRYRSKAALPGYYKLILNFKNSTSKMFYMLMSQWRKKKAAKTRKGSSYSGQRSFSSVYAMPYKPLLRTLRLWEEYWRNILARKNLPGKTPWTW